MDAEVECTKYSLSGTSTLYRPASKMDIQNAHEKHHMITCLSVRTIDVLAAFSAEFIGTFLLLLLTCAGSVFWNSTVQPGYLNAFNSGLVIMIIIQCFGNVSGAIVNPAVTLSALIYGKLSIPMALLYFVAQILGGLAGSGLLLYITPSDVYALGGQNGFCSTVPNPTVSIAQAMTVEYVATMVLVTISCTAWDPRNAKLQDSIALKLGLTVSALSIAFGAYTGCSMNPARSFAPAFWNNTWTLHWIYWIAPISSSTITTLLYKTIFWKSS